MTKNNSTKVTESTKTKGDNKMKNNTNNTVVNNIEGMDVKMNINVTAVVKKTGLELERVLEVAKELNIELSESGKKFLNVESTAAVSDAISNAATKEKVEEVVTKEKTVNRKFAPWLNETKTEVKYGPCYSTVEGYEKLKDYENLDAKHKNSTNRYRALEIMDQLAAGKITVKMYNAINKFKKSLTPEEQDTCEILLADAILKSSKKNFKNVGAVKRWTKDIPVVLLRRVVNAGGGMFYTEIAPQTTSALIDACTLVDKDVADKKMTLHGLTTDELLLFSFEKEALKVNSDNIKESIDKKDKLIKTFNMLAGKSEKKIFIVERKSGIADFYQHEKQIKLRKGDVAKQYEFLGITPSGLRSGTMTLAITQEIHADGTIIKRDRRIQILDKSSNNAFSKNFITGYDENNNPIFKECDSLLEAFKNMSRMMLSATSSKNLGSISTSLVVKNLSHNAGHNEDIAKYNIVTRPGDEGFVDCSDTTDGLGFLSVAMVEYYLKKANIPCSVKDLLGMTFQSRGGGTKIASMLRSKASMRLEAKTAISQGVEVLKAIYKGKELDVKELLANEELLNDFLDNLEGLFDANGMKLLKHDNVFDILMLKKAYSSESKLSDVVNIILMITDEVKATALLTKKIKKDILKKISDMGITLEHDEETDIITNVKCDLKKLKQVNNDSQLVNWLFKSFPEIMVANSPGIQKTNFNSLLKGLANEINELNVEVDCEYTVIQSDPAVRFGVRLLHDDEVYCPSLLDVKKVSAVRHPVSNLFAVSTFKTVDLKTLLARIDDLQITVEQKAMLFEFYQNVEGYAIIPASHYYMEKHDGMDFDIDAMQFFKDPEVIEILEKVSDIGTIIDRKIDVKMNCSIQDSDKDIVFKSYIADLNKKKFTPIMYKKKEETETIDETMDEKIAAYLKSMPGMANISNKTVVKEENAHYKPNANGKYDLDFSSIAMMVLDYFLNPIDPVGVMASNFYNNAKILLALKSSNEEVTKDMKLFIQYAMRTMFSCPSKADGEFKYISPIRKDKDGNNLDYSVRNKIILYKDICHQVIEAFTKSNGSYADCLNFLTDMCICSRYTAETSIDSAKNMYKVINMFALSNCITAMGCKNAVKFENFDPFAVDKDGELIEAQESIDKFNMMIAVLNANSGEDAVKYEPNNFFELKLIKTDEKCEVWNGKAAAISALHTEKQVAGVKDPIYLLKERLMNFANSVVIIAAKELEAYVKSPEAEAIRKDFKDSYTEKEKYFKVHQVVSNIVGNYITLTESIKISNDDEIDDATVKKYLQKQALQACRNTAKLSFKTAADPLSDETIGAGVFYYMITSFEAKKSKCPTVHSEILAIFQNEILAFLKSKGMNVLAAEEIQYAINAKTNRQVKLEALVGSTCDAYKGHGEVESLINDDTYLVTLKNKKATFENAVISLVDGKYVAIQEREAVEDNLDAGFYFSAKMDKGLIAKVKDQMDVVTKKYNKPDQRDEALSKISANNMLADCNYDEIVFQTKKVKSNGKNYNANFIIGKTGDQESVIAELYLNTVVSKLLADTQLSLDNLKIFMTAKGCAISIVDTGLLAEVETAMNSDTSTDLFGDGDIASITDETIEFGSDTPVPTSDDEEMISEVACTNDASNENDFSGYDIDLYGEDYAMPDQE